MVKRIHNTNDSVRQLQMKFFDVDCLTGFLNFLLFETNFNFMLFETNFVSVICSYAIWYLIILLFFIFGFCII